MKTIAISSHSTILPSEVISVESPYDIQFMKADFDTREALGKKGTRCMDRLTGLAISCIQKAMSVLTDQRDQEPHRMGIVVGSAQGSMDSIVRFTHETLAHDSPDYVNPALFPNTVMNCAAGQSAIWHSLKGPNATISGGELSSFAAINYAITLLNKDYADTLISGGIEELTEVNIAANIKLAEKMVLATKFSEGSVFFVIEHSETSKKYKRNILATIDAIEIGFNPSFEKSDALYSLIESALTSVNITAEDISVVSIAGAWPQTKEIEISAVRHLLNKNKQIRLLNTFDKYGNAVSCHNAMQISSVIDQFEGGQNAILVAQDLKGNIGVMVINKGDKQ
jgi:3-oxoacyl-[acyl-carrier-protein] synthase II